MPPLSSRTDQELVRGWQGGDTAALDSLFARYQQRLFSFLSRWTGDDHVAEDLLQETFLRMLREPDRHAINGEVLPWLYRMARNLAVDDFRRRRVALSVDAEEEQTLADSRPLALERLTAEERQHHLESALALLPVTHREVLLLRGVEGLDHETIGVVLNCTEGAARVRLHRATVALRRIWFARHGEDDARNI